MYALVDVDCMYVSCERAIDPRLEGQPVVVLSNNDSAIVSRSREVKKLGISSFERWRGIHQQYPQIIARSSNYELYGDMSARFMAILGRHTPDLLPYSIDEAFLKPSVTMDAYQRREWATGIQKDIRRLIGLPISIGIAPTMTLAKLASHGAKSSPSLNGICDWDAYTPEQQHTIMAALPVSEVWGVGRGYTQRLQRIGVHTVDQLAELDPRVYQKKWGTPFSRTIRELNQQPAHNFYDPPTGDKSLMHGRMLRHGVSDPELIVSLVALYAQHAARRARHKNRYATTAEVFLSSSTHEDGTNTFASVTFPQATNDGLTITRALTTAIRRTLPTHGSWYRICVLLNGLVATPQLILDPPIEHHDLDHAIDRIRDRLNQDIIGWGLAGLRDTHSWQIAADHLSKRATTRWNELLTVTI